MHEEDKTNYIRLGCYLGLPISSSLFFPGESGNSGSYKAAEGTRRLQRQWVYTKLEITQGQVTSRSPSLIFCYHQTPSNVQFLEDLDPS